MKRSRGKRRESYDRHPEEPFASTILAAVAELHRGLSGRLVGRGAGPGTARGVREGAVVLATPASLPALVALRELPARRGLGDEGYLVRGPHRSSIGRRSSPPTPTSASSTARSISCACCRPSAHRRARRSSKRAAHPAPHAQPLGQPRRQRRARLRRRFALGLAQAARLRRRRATRDYARANASLGINGTVLTNVNANATSLTAEYLDEGGGARRRVPAVRHPRLPDGALQRAHRDRRPQDRRSARPGRASVVEDEGRRDLQASSRTSAASS